MTTTTTSSGSISLSNATTDTINWRLDKLYEQTISYLKELIHHSCQDEQQFNICMKWFKVLDKTSEHEKMARNCLANLMMHQLQVTGKVSLPFTNVKNCNLNLEKVLQDLSEHENEYDEGLLRLLSRERTLQKRNEEDRFSSGFEVLSVINEDTEPETSKTKQHEKKVIFFNDPLQTEAATTSSYSENVDLVNKRLHVDLRNMRANLKQKGQEIKKLEIKYKNIQMNIQANNCPENAEVKCHILKLLRNYLIRKNASDIYEYPTMPIRAFESIFCSALGNDTEFANDMRQYDCEFNRILINRFRCEYKSRKHAFLRHANKKFMDYKIKVRKKCEERIKFLNWIRILHLKLIKLKCFSALRKVFVNTYVGEEEKMWEELAILESRYQNLLNEII